MKGTVEIYTKFGTPEQKLIHSESNLVVDGMGENICELLTTPSSVTTQESGLFDTSNYTVNAISFGKASSNYSVNAHAFSAANLLHNSHDFSASSWKSVVHSGVFNDLSTVLANVYEGPEPGVSASLLVDDSSSIGLGIGQGWVFNGSSGEYSTYPPVGTWLAFSVDLKYNFENPPGVASGVDGIDRRYSSLLIRENSVGVHFVTISWDASGKATIPTDLHNTAFTRGAIKPVGNGFYRIYSSILTGAGGVSIDYVIFPCAGHTILTSGSVEELQGSIIAARPRVQVGRWTTETPETLYISNRDDLDITGTLSTSTVYGLSEVGTVRTDSSSYHPITGLPSYANPADKVLEENTITPIDIALGINSSVGHNLNKLAFSDTSDVSITDLDSDITLGLGYSGELGPQAFYLGCYPRNLAGTPYALVSAMDLEGINNPITTGNFTGYHNDASSMDEFGRIRTFYSLRGATSDPTSGCIVSAISDFSSTGEVSYVTTLAAGELGMSNLFGGIYNMGLWGFDYGATLRAEGVSNFPFSQLDTRGAYRLLSKRVFNDNIARSDDSGTAGIDSHQDITIVWRLKFL